MTDTPPTGDAPRATTAANQGDQIDAPANPTLSRPGDMRPSNPVRRTAARAARAGSKLIWIVPVIALLVTLGFAWKTLSGRGTLVQVSFSDATGITPGETLLKFREISVGKVEAVRFTTDLQRVVVDIRVDKDVAPYVDDTAEFWIVRPQVSAQGISRLDTVLTGVFIEGWWDADPNGNSVQIHEGLERAPLARNNQPGTWITLTSDDAKGMSEGAPVSFRGLTVGHMQNLRLADKDETVLADAFIASPHDQRLTTTTVFWDTSGFSVSLGAQGLALNVTSVASLLQGGVAFATLSSGGQPIQPGHIYRLQPDEAAARDSLFSASPDQELKMTVLVDDAVRGLTQGADVQFQGLSAGRVTNLAVRVEPPTEPGGRGRVLQDISIALDPQRMGLPDTAGPSEALAFLQSQVAEGLRARIAGAGFLGTSLMIELTPIDDAAPATIDTAAEPFPVMPSVPADLGDFSASAQGLMTRISSLPLEELLKSATDAMNSVTAIASSQDTRAIPGSVRRTVDEAQTTIVDLRDKMGTAVDRISAAADNIDAVTKQIRDNGSADGLRTALDETSQAMQAVREAAKDVPGMVDQIDSAAESIDEFDFAGISAEAKGILEDVRRMIGSDDAAQLPRNLSDTLKAASGLLNDLRDGNAAGNLNDTLASARAAADNIAEAARRVPTVAQRYEELALRGSAVISAYGDRGAFNTELINTLRTLRGAAQSFGSLATTIERNPRAFILGR